MCLVNFFQAMVLATAAEQGWSLSSIPVVIDLAKNLASDPEVLSNLKMDRTTASYKMKHGLAFTIRQRTVKVMQTQPFSLNIDEATSSNTCKVLAVLVNYVDSAEKRVVTEHLTSISLIRADAQSIFDAIDKFFEDENIPWVHLTSILMDSCSVMRGSKAGFETLIRDKRASHLLNIDGDVNHHVHNAVKKFCAPFDYWVEGLFTDINNEFQHSTINQDVLREICTILDVKYTVPQNFVLTRWLSVYDVSLSTMVQLKALTVYSFPLLPKEDRKLYRSIYSAIIKDVPKAGKRRLEELGSEHAKRARTEAGKKRKERITNKLFIHRRWTKLVLSFYNACLADMKRYVMLFQSDNCKVHLLHKKQILLFKRFLAMFLPQEDIDGLDAEGLQDPEVLKIEDSILPPEEIFFGATTEQLLKVVSKSTRHRFVNTASKALTACGVYLQSKLPLNNPVLQSMQVLDPISFKTIVSTESKLVLKDLPTFLPNLFSISKEDLDDDAMIFLEDEEEKEENDFELDLTKLEAYHKEVLDLCTAKDLPPTSLPVDEWWSRLPDRFVNVKLVASALLTCFTGPKVESAFSCMGNIMDPKSNRMAVSTLSAIQTVRYSLQGSRKSAVDCFKRPDKQFSPINRALCQNMRSARKRDKAEKKEEKEKKEKEKVALSLKLTRLESKKQAKARLEAAEKAARIAHRTRCKAVLNAKLEKLVSFQSVLFIYSCSFVLII